jgi:hypothetical protein
MLQRVLPIRHSQQCGPTLLQHSQNRTAKSNALWHAVSGQELVNCFGELNLQQRELPLRAGDLLFDIGDLCPDTFLALVV